VNISYLSARWCSAPGLTPEINIKCICKHLSTRDSNSRPGARHRADDAYPRRGETERNTTVYPLPFETEAGLVKDRRVLRVSVSLCAWTVMSSEWMSGADRSLSLHTHTLTRPKKMKWKRRRN